MSVKLYSCDCLWDEIGNQVKDSPVKGYTLVSECAACSTKRAANAVAAAAQKEAQDRQRKIIERANEDAWKKAEQDLKNEGKIS